jgi:ribosomal protein S24E
MEVIKIVQEKENPLFSRKEVRIIVNSETNPSFIEAEKLISEKYSSNPENIKIDGIKGKFGRHTFLITSSIYKSVQDKEKNEPKPKKKKEGNK